MPQLSSLLRIILGKLFLLGVFSVFLVKGLCPSWFLGLIFSIAVFQLTGIVLVRLLRPHASLDLSPTLMSRATWALSVIWIATLFVQSSLMGNGSGLYIKHLGYAVLGALQIFCFAQAAPRWSSLLVPATAFLRPRA